METTPIGWTDATWNPWIGCEHVSTGCDNCYMFSDMRRYGQNPEVVRRTMSATFNAPLKWVRKNSEIQRVFTCSWSDFFITDADEWRSEAWEIIRRTPQLTYQILTKRPVLIQRRLPADWGEGWPNCWLGVTMESRDYLERLNVLRRVPAAIRFASFEPVQENLGDIDLTGIHWAIIGGESHALLSFRLDNPVSRAVRRGGYRMLRETRISLPSRPARRAARSHLGGQTISPCSSIGSRRPNRT
jgi:protein gp37